MFSPCMKYILFIYITIQRRSMLYSALYMIKQIVHQLEVVEVVWHLAMLAWDASRADTAARKEMRKCRARQSLLKRGNVKEY